MKEEIYSQQELQKLEEEIRAMGIPYSENEPDERYFANFRVRLMDKIDAKEKKSASASIWSWISGSPLRGFSLAAGLAGVIIAVLLMRQGPHEQVAKVEQQPVQPKVEQPAQQIIPQEKLAAIPEESNKSYKSHRSHKTYKTNDNLAARKNKLEEAANKAGNFATMDPRLSGDNDDPVNLESLSAGELQSVLEAVQSMK